MPKPVLSLTGAVADISDGATVLIGGFGGAGSPVELVHALLDQGARDLVLVNNNAGNGDVGLAVLIRENRVRRIICSFPRSSDSHVFDDAYRAGRIELELVPQGTLAERLRAAGAGIPAFYTRTGVGTDLARGREIRSFHGRDYMLEESLPGDIALIKAETADTAGNLTYHLTARNFAPVMAMAAKTTIVQASHIVEAGAIDPERVVTAGIFVDRLVHVAAPEQEETLVKRKAFYP